MQLLALGAPAEVEARRDRLGKAIANFDAATIETTHGFCLQVLYGLGTAGDVDREVTLVEDVSDLMEEVVDDLFLRRFAHKPNALEFDRREAMEIAKAALGHPDADMVPPLSQAERPALHPAPLRQGGAPGDGGPQEGAQDPDLRRRAQPPPRHPLRRGARARRLRPAA